jgi:hypothetical protein
MPYIDDFHRNRLEPHLERLLDQLSIIADEDRDGVLNYVVTRIVARTLSSRGWRYRTIARAIAVFEAAKLEFYRRVAAPYEDKAIAKNGDINEYMQ